MAGEREQSAAGVSNRAWYRHDRRGCGFGCRIGLLLRSSQLLLLFSELLLKLLHALEQHLHGNALGAPALFGLAFGRRAHARTDLAWRLRLAEGFIGCLGARLAQGIERGRGFAADGDGSGIWKRSEEHTSELQSL